MVRNAAQFDPSAQYVAYRQFLLGSIVFAPGDRVPIAVAGERRLRQLFDIRRVVQATTEVKPAAAPGGKVKPNGKVSA